jgi:competence protein ComEC
MRGIRTRFRAYHLGSAGSSFSYFADGHFTIIGAWKVLLGEPAAALR